MGTGVSLILIAVGAILTWAVTATASGFNINTVGIILMVVGAVGLVLSLMFWSTWGGFGGDVVDHRHLRRRNAPGDEACGEEAAGGDELIDQVEEAFEPGLAQEEIGAGDVGKAAVTGARRRGMAQ